MTFLSKILYRITNNNYSRIIILFVFSCIVLWLSFSIGSLYVSRGAWASIPILKMAFASSIISIFFPYFYLGLENKEPDSNASIIVGFLNIWVVFFFVSILLDPGDKILFDFHISKENYLWCLMFLGAFHGLVTCWYLHKKIIVFPIVKKNIAVFKNENSIYENYVLNPQIKSGRLTTYCSHSECDWKISDIDKYDIIRKCPECDHPTFLELSFGGVTIRYNPSKDNYHVLKSNYIDNADCPDIIAFMLKTLKYNRL